MTREKRILKLICNHFKISIHQVIYRSDREGVEPRQIAALLLYRHTESTYMEVAEILDYSGKQDVYAAIKCIQKISSANKALSATIGILETQILEK